MLIPLILNTESLVVSDTTPDAFDFTDVTGVALSSVQTSDAITVSGIDAPSTVSVEDGEYSINGGAYTAAIGFASDGDTITVRHIAGDEYSEAITTTLTIGGVSGSFTSTTLASAEVLGTVPYLIGATKTNALAMLEAAAMGALVEGTGRTVSAQSVDPYTEVAIGTVITITLGDATYTPRPSRLGGAGRPRYGSGIH